MEEVIMGHDEKPKRQDSKLKELRRKCFKCGKSPIKDNVALFRFPRPATRNILRCMLWAKYMFPNDEAKYTSIVFHNKLYNEHRMLCDNHFLDTDFVDETRRSFLYKLSAVPTCTDETSSTSTSKDKDVVIDTFDHCYTRFREPPPPTQTRLIINLKPNVDATVPTANAATESNSQIHQSHSIDNLIDDVAGNDHSDEEEPLFSWQAPNQISIEDEDFDEVLSISKEHNLSKQIPGEDSKKKEDEDPIQIDGLDDIAKVPEKDSASNVNEEEMEYKKERHTGYSCDYCMGEIIGFRYKCVQCENYDLCGACEARLVHPHHYVLRLPRPTPYNEVQSMVEAIRDMIKMQTSDSLALDEIKEEAPFEEVQVDPFEELETADLVPEVPVEAIDEVVRFPRGTEVKQRRHISAKTQNLLKEWDMESATKEASKPEVPKITDNILKVLRSKKTISKKPKVVDNTVKRPRKRKLETIKSKDLENIETTAIGSRNRKEDGDVLQDGTTINLDYLSREQRRKYSQSICMDEDIRTVDKEIRHLENDEIEWLDESILESEEEDGEKTSSAAENESDSDIDINQELNDKLRKMKHDLKTSRDKNSESLKIDIDQKLNYQLEKMKRDLNTKRNPNKESSKIDINQKLNDGVQKIQHKLKLNSPKQVPRKSSRAKKNTEVENVELKKMLESDRKRVNILRKSSRINESKSNR